MGYFPVFLNLGNKKIIIIGGGEIANNKLTQLLAFTKDIKIIAPFLSLGVEKQIKKYDLVYEKREYKTGDIKGYYIIIVATNSLDLQRDIYNESRQYNALCNCVDLSECCDMYFGSYIKKGDLAIAISTNGSSPAFAKYLRRFLENIIPNSVDKFLTQMKEYRSSMKKGKDRMKFFDNKVQQYISSWGLT